ncbi:MAG: hypothetical protein K2N23_05855 [Clostridia bacterium]|nr:hypothetical protein [Clostridia bacterium]
MNKFKKLAIASVSVVMAGTMALSFAACGGKPDSGDNGGGGNKGVVVGTDHYGVLKEDGVSLNYDVYKNRGNVTLNVAIGSKGTLTSTTFQGIGDEITLPDGVKYSNRSVKPAWVQMGKDLNITWDDKYMGDDTGNNLKQLYETIRNGETVYSKTDLFTTDLSEAVSYAATDRSMILNLADYLDRMPNFTKFLAENPIVYLSLLQEGMSTSDGSNQTIYIAPYFDGYDDIERYCLIRHDWAEKLLNSDTATGATAKYAEVCTIKTGGAKETQTYADAFMGSDNYTVDALTADGSNTQKITKDYAAVVTALGGNTPLATAYKAITNNKAYAGTSGNIVDVMNAALKENINASGEQLVNLFRAYIDVCYKNEKGESVYSATNRANLFTGYDACWDVDELVAMLRCVKTNASVLVGSGKTIDGITPRAGTNDRTPTMVSLACQLYGVRGGTSRLEYTYIDNNGDLKDARTEKVFYQAMEKMHALRSENLIADYKDMKAYQTASGLGIGDNKGKTEYFMAYDYSQSQTLAGLKVEDNGVSYTEAGTIPKGYYFAPVMTPVSTWDVDGNGSYSEDEYFRFTESWRSTKTSGLAVNGAVAKDEKKLDAALQFIDYLYSEDGQIVSTFGPMAENADGKGGFWYNEVQSNPKTKVDPKTGKNVPENYFTYKGVKYAGSDYKGAITPTITDKFYESFKGKRLDGVTNFTGDLADVKLNYNNYARYLIGSTLPIGVKNQSFENQLTSKMGQAGAKIVGTALDKGIIKGMSLDIDANNYWFTCVPTGLPVAEDFQRNVLNASNQLSFRYLTGEKRTDDSFFSIMNYIILYGTSGHYDMQSVVVDYTSIEDLLDKPLVTNGAKISKLAENRQIVYADGWTTAKAYWAYLEPILNGTAK